MTKHYKIKMITDYVSGKIPRSALAQGEVYWELAVNQGGRLVRKTHIKDGRPISKEQFDRETAGKQSTAIIWKEVKSYE